jgi:hypothetical protein
MPAAVAPMPPGRSHIAPAGCGKTTRIVQELAGRGGLRSLVLTHTNAGVGVLRARLKEHGVPGSKAVISTIDGWCLRLVKAYPRTAGIATTANDMPSWQEIRNGAIRILSHAFGREIVRASYSRIDVDEYQDCSLDQHAVVEALAGMVETHVYGDPLQGIFAFRGQETHVVSWTEHIQPIFPVEATDTWSPHRWARSPDLGRFVERLRREIIAGGPINLVADGVAIETPHPAGDLVLLRRSIPKDGTRTLVIRDINQRCHYLAQRVGPPYKCIEPVDCPALRDFIVSIQGAVGSALPNAVLDLLMACRKDTKPVCRRVVAHLGKPDGPKKRPAHQSIRPVVDSCERLMRDGTVAAMVEVMEHFAGNHAYRPDPIRILMDASRIDAGNLSGLSASIDKVHERDRHLARRMPWCGIGTTKLVKGLEADNVIAMDVAGMDASDLYVALTRATRRLTVVSATSVLPAPRRPARVAQAIQAGII